MMFPLQLSTVVKNTSGQDDQFFAYLGAHGVTLDDGDTYVEDGDLIAKLSAKRMPISARMRAALMADLQDGRLSILQTPRAIDVGAYDSPVALSVHDDDNTFVHEELDYSVVEPV